MTRLYNYLYDNPFVYLPLGIIVATSYIIMHYESYIKDGKLDPSVILVWWFLIFIWPLIVLIAVPLEILGGIIQSLRK